VANYLKHFSFIKHFLSHPFVQLVIIYELIRIIIQFVVLVVTLENYTAIFSNLIPTLAFQISILLLVAILLILLTKYIRKIQVIILIICAIIFPLFIIFNTIDSIVYGLVGMRFSPSVLKNHLNMDWTHPLYIGMIEDYMLPIILGIVMSVFLITWLFRSLRSSIEIKSNSLSPWFLVKSALFTLSLFVVSLTPKSKPIEPLELLYGRYLVGWDKVSLADEQAAFDQLREFIGLPDGRKWLTYDYPLVHVPKTSLKENRPQLDYPDIIIIFMESLRGENLIHINPDANPLVPTPSLTKLSKQAVIFPWYISNAFPSAPSYIAINHSIWPHQTENVASEFLKIEYESVSDRLRRRSYKTLYVENYPRFDKHESWVKDYFDEPLYIPTGMKDSDQSIFQISLNKIQEADSVGLGQPIFAFIQTRSPHMPYKTPNDSTGDFEFGPGVIDNYIKSMGYVDHYLGKFIDGLRLRKRWENTLLIIVGDHANYLDFAQTSNKSINDTQWTSGMMVGPERLIGKPRTVYEHVSHVDIGPTLLAMVNDTDPSPFVGKDVFNRTSSSALAIREGSVRYDANGQSILVDRLSGIMTLDIAFPVGAVTPENIDFDEMGSVLFDITRTMSYLYENDRIWEPHLLRTGSN